VDVLLTCAISALLAPISLSANNPWLALRVLVDLFQLIPADRLSKSGISTEPGNLLHSIFISEQRCHDVHEIDEVVCALDLA
jgi:hypothetical protein